MSYKAHTTFCAFFGTGLLIGFSALNRCRRRIKTMPNYTITATITKINSDGKIVLKGVGKHLYEDSNKKQWNLLEEITESGTRQNHQSNQETVFKSNSKMVDLKTNFSVGIPEFLGNVLFATTMLQKKPLKLTISEDDKTGYTITEIEVP